MRVNQPMDVQFGEMTSSIRVTDHAAAFTPQYREQLKAEVKAAVLELLAQGKAADADRLLADRIFQPEKSSRS